jgi:hypothetical protein
MSKKPIIIAVVLILVVTIAITGCPLKTEPATPADFYKGKSGNEFSFLRRENSEFK